ncbi:MAG: methyltransferase domain-containing protein [Kangiellaceae bacterium]|nr:methyltransferase domain-containing protein [Kangiellaceae bacterium]
MLIKHLTKVVFTLISIVAVLLTSQTIPAKDSIYQQAINHPDRPKSDFEQDASRKPLSILPFSRIKPGAKVLEIGAGGGYTTELVARIVGEKGHVYAETLSLNRLSNNRLTNVTALRRHKLYQLPDVLEENAVRQGQLDNVIIFFALHDVMMNSRIDQDDFLNNLFNLLKPGGHFVVLDNAGEANSGLQDTKRLHRIGENYVKEKVISAGFKFEAKSDALRNPNDKLSESWRSIRGKQDRFAFRFVKPLK